MSDSKNYDDLAMLMITTDHWINLSEEHKNGYSSAEEVVDAFNTFMMSVAIKIVAATMVTSMLGEETLLNDAIDNAENRLADLAAKLAELKTNGVKE